MGEGSDVAKDQNVSFSMEAQVHCEMINCCRR